MLTAFTNAVVFDGSSWPFDNTVVVVEDDRIVSLDRAAPRSASHVVDCKGGFLMPGLIDAHFHACAPSFNIWSTDQMFPSLLASYATKSLEATLRRGFTTVRDAGGGDAGLAMGIERGVIDGPRFFFSGKAISQTGGHGDFRPGDRIDPCGCSAYLGSMSLVADGADAVRKAAREELRKGATQIKIFVSGGGLSPTDPMWMPQFTDEEISAAVYETSTRRTYVMAHSHTDDASRRCALLGVRSIEHGSMIHSEETARIIAENGAFVVPTLSVVDVLSKHASELGLPPMSLTKIEDAAGSMLNAIQVCERAGVKLGFGTDLLELRFQALQGGEFALRGQVSSAIDVLRSATSVNAEIVQMQGKLGCIKPDAFADLIVIDGDPLRDLSLFNRIETLPVVMKAGKFVRNTLS